MPIPLSFLDEASVHDISALKIEELSALAKRLDLVIETQDRRKKVLTEALKLRFGETAVDLLHQEGKDTGTVRFREDNALIIANFRKKVDWDQDVLREILKEYPELQPTIKCSYSVEEKHYGALPEETQKILEPARSVKVAGYDFTIKEEK